MCEAVLFQEAYPDEQLVLYLIKDILIQQNKNV